MVYDNEINALEAEDCELGARFDEYRAEILKANALLSTSFDAKAIEKATIRKQAAIQAGANIERRRGAIEAEIRNYRDRQQGFPGELARVTKQITDLKERLNQLTQHVAEEDQSLIRLRAGLETTERRFGRLPQPSPWAMQDPTAYIRAELETKRDHQRFHVNRLTAQIPITKKLVAETETSIAITERYLAGLRQMA